MNWETWLLFLLTEIVLSMSPGPAVLLVISQSLRGGRWQGICAALGILSANVIWFTLSAIGVGTVILTAGPWFIGLKWVGATYLVYLAGRALIGNDHAAGDSAQEVPPAISGRSIWMNGLVLQLTNPKALVFFVALLPQFVDPRQPTEPQVLILGITSLAAEFPVLAIYAALAGRASVAARDRRLGRAMDMATAVLLLIAAIGVVATA